MASTIINNRFVRWWLTPKFPTAHVAKVVSYKPVGVYAILRNIYRTWIVHPLKRRAAKLYVNFLQNYFGLKVIGISGSSGKTTTKEMLASILKKTGNTVFSIANIDPVYNIPTTIFKCRPITKYLILEMGVEYPNEMDFYLWLAKPNVGIITNIYTTHTLFFKNIDGVYKEKSKLVKGIPKTAHAVLNSESFHLRKLEGKLKAKVTWYGGKSPIKSLQAYFTGDFKTRFMLKMNDSNIPINLPVLGKQFVENALAAAAAAKLLGIGNKEIKRGLESFKNQEHRMNINKLKSGAILIDDSYNNNPEAAKRAIEMLKEVSGKRNSLLVFGDMLELGSDEVLEHKEISKYISDRKIDYVVGVGPLSQKVCTDKKYWAKDWREALPIVNKLMRGNMVVLVKGSRSIGLDNLVSAIK
jgi:UDP-N-acetylmuramoyl-tripeptide--D-alanyl-D-alanine ligase